MIQDVKLGVLLISFNLIIEPFKLKQVANVLNCLFFIKRLQFKHTILQPLPIINKVRSFIYFKKGIQFQFGVKPILEFWHFRDLELIKHRLLRGTAFDGFPFILRCVEFLEALRRQPLLHTITHIHLYLIN